MSNPALLELSVAVNCEITSRDNIACLVPIELAFFATITSQLNKAKPRLGRRASSRCYLHIV